MELVAGGDPVGRVADEAAQRLAAAEDARDDVALLRPRTRLAGRAARARDRAGSRVEGPDHDHLARLDVAACAWTSTRVRQLQRRRWPRRNGADVRSSCGPPSTTHRTGSTTSAGAVPPGDVLPSTEASGSGASNDVLVEGLRDTSGAPRASASRETARRPRSASMSRAITPWASRNGIALRREILRRGRSPAWTGRSPGRASRSRPDLHAVDGQPASRRSESRAVSAASKTGGLVSWRSRL